MFSECRIQKYEQTNRIHIKSRIFKSVTSEKVNETKTLFVNSRLIQFKNENNCNRSMEIYSFIGGVTYVFCKYCRMWFNEKKNSGSPIINFHPNGVKFVEYDRIVKENHYFILSMFPPKLNSC